MSTVKIDDEYVKRILINQSQIERTFLAQTRLEGQTLLQNIQGAGMCWTAEMMSVRRYPYDFLIALRSLCS